METEKKILPNKLIIERTIRKHHIRYVFTDLEGNKFYVAFNSLRKEILTDFISEAMRAMGFYQVPRESKRNLGRFKYICKVHESFTPDEETFLPYEGIILPSVYSSGARVETYQRKVAQGIERLAIKFRHATGKERDDIIENIRQGLDAVEEGLEMEFNF